MARAEAGNCYKGNLCLSQQEEWGSIKEHTIHRQGTAGRPEHRYARQKYRSSRSISYSDRRTATLAQGMTLEVEADSVPRNILNCTR
jgi:hypothetical protein